MNNSRVLNLTRGYGMKYKRALRAIDECACMWVEEGKTVRDLTLAESIAARNQQAQLREALPLIELRGLRYEAPEAKIDSDFWQKRVEQLRKTGEYVFLHSL